MQDTLLCYEALTQYAVRQTNRDIYQMEVILESTAASQWKQTIRLNMTNFDVLYSDQVGVITFHSKIQYSFSVKCSNLKFIITMEIVSQDIAQI